MVLQLWLHLIILLWVTTSASCSDTKPGCREKCGNVSVPYPFGFGDSKCFRDEGYELFCNNAELFSNEEHTISVHNILLNGQLRLNLDVSKNCYNESGKQSSRFDFWIRLGDIRPYRFSETQNKFTATGCDTLAYVTDYEGQDFTSGCASICNNISHVPDTCSGIGCCQTSIPKNLKAYNVTFFSYYNHTKSWEFKPCSYAFLVDQDWFNFSASYLKDFQYETVPVVLDWVILNQKCEEAVKNTSTYACHNNSNCSNSPSGRGYLCNCLEGYEGNPYLPQGCQDIDECANPSEYPCNGTCNNTPGNYSCTCPRGTHGDGKDSCVKNDNKFSVVPVSIVIILGVFTLFAGSYLLHEALKKRKLIKLREKFFQKNGGLLLQQQRAKIFTAEELEEATNHYDVSQIVGRGGYGTVYRGMLTDQRIVAIKKSRMVDESLMVDESQIQQFVNEVCILSQINHRNVVKLLGCCLETKVPMLVYEFVSHGTLSQHIHKEGRHTPLMSWENRLRVAAETAEALAYLHSAAYPPIIHRDVKSTNILLDENNTAKVSDFGASMLVPLDQTKVATLVQGTLGYLDPEYFQTGELTMKSDVYSFGVVLLELFTGKKPISSGRSQEEKNLVKYFISSIKENRLFQILEAQVANEGEVEQLQAFSKLAETCLRMKGEERPSMKEVAVELERLRKFHEHPWVKRNHEENESLLNEPAYGFASNGVESSQNITATSIELGSYGSSSTL